MSNLPQNRSQPKRLLIMACSQRKRPDPGLLPAIERYDGPQFQVLRKFIREHPESAKDIATYILSAQFGLIPAYHEIPNYDRRMTDNRASALNSQVQKLIADIFKSETFSDLFLSLGRSYLIAIQGFESLLPTKLHPNITDGSMGRRQGELRNWLYQGIIESNKNKKAMTNTTSAIIRGKKIDMSQSQILEFAQRAIPKTVGCSENFQTWYVEIDNHKVSPKWLVSQLTGLPVSDFHSGDALRVLKQLGIEVKRV